MAPSVAGPSDASTPAPHGDDPSTSYPNPNVQNNPYIYLAVYSSVPVYEMIARGIGVMRRRSDSYLNATQILKVAGVDKGKRTKILEKDIALGVHEKVQGGYGRYQGTWIPFERAVELANQFGVAHLLAPLFDYTPPPPPVSLGPGGSPSTISGSRYVTPGSAGKEATQRGDHDGQSAATILSKAREAGLLPPDMELPRPTPKRPMEDEAMPDEPKRAKVDTNGSAPIPLPVTDGKLRRSTKADTTGADDPLRAERHKMILKNIFALGDADGALASGEDEPVPDLASLFPADLDPDMAIDDHGHTALHWAAALARVSIVKALVHFGADMHRGNTSGETPLVRAVLVTNNSDQDAFARLLDVLGPSLRTVDDKGMTVLHHAAMVAAVKGRAASARYYMESVLEFVARRERGRFRELVDAQDDNGDTALNIAARVGNRGLVRILVEVGADKAKANKLGLRPSDFGCEAEELRVTPGEEATANLRTDPATTAPVRKSSEVLAALDTIIASLTDDFKSELEGKQEALERTKSQLKEATRLLADQRKVLAAWRGKAHEMEDKAQRVRNLERALEDEDAFDWTGRTEIDGSPAVASAGPGFTYRGPASTLSNLPAGITIEFEADPPPPETDTDEHSLVHLMRLQAWYGRVIALLRQRVERLQGGGAELELNLQRILASCCGVEPDRVDDMLDGLVSALESDGPNMDLGRIASFLVRVKDRSAVDGVA